MVGLHVHPSLKEVNKCPEKSCCLDLLGDMLARWQTWPPRCVPRVLKGCSDGPKSRPGSAQATPKGAQGVPKSAPVVPKGAQMVPKVCPGEPKGPHQSRPDQGGKPTVGNSHGTMGRPIGRAKGRPMGRAMGIPMGRPMGHPLGRPMGRPTRFTNSCRSQRLQIGFANSCK